MCAIKRSLQDAYYKQNQLAFLLQVRILTALCLLGNFFLHCLITLTQNIPCGGAVELDDLFICYN